MDMNQIESNKCEDILYEQTNFELKDCLRENYELARKRELHKLSKIHSCKELVLFLMEIFRLHSYCEIVDMLFYRYGENNFASIKAYKKFKNEIKNYFMINWETEKDDYE